MEYQSIAPEERRAVVYLPEPQAWGVDLPAELAPGIARNLNGDESGAYLAVPNDLPFLLGLPFTWPYDVLNRELFARRLGDDS